MLMRAIAIVLGVVGLYLNIWHGQALGGGANLLPFSHNAIGLGTNHTLHSVVGLIPMGAAVWLWVRAPKMRSSSRTEAASRA
jgi:hypothetical protein